mgnify:CR=1 FL=1
MIITTTPSVEGRAIREYKGIVFGEVISGVNFMKDLGAGLRNFFGGRSACYEEELQKAREEALEELEQRAGAMGANAVIGVDIDYEVLGADNGMLMVTASGTAVVVIKAYGSSKKRRKYLAHVTGTLRHRITQLDDSIEAGQKESKECTSITGKTTQRWTSMATKISITSRHFSMRSMPAMKRSSCAADSVR